MYEVEFHGGPHHGRQMAIPNLLEYWQMPALARSFLDEAVDIAVGRIGVEVDQIATYRLERNTVTGEPNRTAHGRYIYRVGERPAPPGVPLWVLDTYPDVTDWRVHGPDQWWGLEPKPFEGLVRCVVQVTRDGRTIRGSLVANGNEWPNADLREHTFQELARECDHQLLPPCAVPECHEKGSSTFRAAADGRLAGKLRESGEEIHLCPPHASDVRRAGYRHDYDGLPAWLQKDAIQKPSESADEWAWHNHYVMTRDGIILPLVLVERER